MIYYPEMAVSKSNRKPPKIMFFAQIPVKLLVIFGQSREIFEVIFAIFVLPHPGWGFVKVSASRGPPCVVMGRLAVWGRWGPERSVRPGRARQSRM